MLIGHRHLRILVLLVTLAVPTACAEDASPVARMGPAGVPPASPDPLAGAPEVGSCHRLDDREARITTGATRSVGCDGQHTSYTFHVGRFPDDAVTADESLARRTCARTFPAGIGLAPDEASSTILDWTWFEPTTEQWASGARWFRCDVVAESAGELRPLPPGGAPYSEDGLDDRWARCLQVRPAGAQTVACDGPHGYRWAGSFTVEAPRYPGPAELRSRAERRCPGIVPTRAWWSTWPSAEAWAAGDRRMACFRSAE